MPQEKIALMTIAGRGKLFPLIIKKWMKSRGISTRQLRFVNPEGKTLFPNVLRIIAPYDLALKITLQLGRSEPKDFIWAAVSRNRHPIFVKGILFDVINLQEIERIHALYDHRAKVGQRGFGGKIESSVVESKAKKKNKSK